MMHWVLFLKKLTKVVVMFALIAWVSSPAAKKRKRKVYTVDFQDEFVEGHIKNPNIFQLFNKRQLKYERLVDLKENFLPEMKRTAGEIE